ncbi:MAG: alkaline phosphatase family protein [Limisphaerales bacterium]
MQKLAAAGCKLTNYFGAFHPSQTNYLASAAGEICAVTNHTPPASPLPQQTIVDLLEPGGVSWKAYMEG